MKPGWAFTALLHLRKSSIEINSIGPNLWMSHDWAGANHEWASEGIGQPTWELGPPTGEPGPQKGFITDRSTPQIHQLSGCLVSDDPAGE